MRRTQGGNATGDNVQAADFAAPGGASEDMGFDFAEPGGAAFVCPEMPEKKAKRRRVHSVRGPPGSVFFCDGSAKSIFKIK